MRRIIALVIVTLMFLQSSAMAAPIAKNGPTEAATLATGLDSVMTPVVGAIEQTWIFALLMGRASLYDEMHAPAPQIPQRGMATVTRQATLRTNTLMPRFLYGMRKLDFGMRSPNAIGVPHRDPLAERHGAPVTNVANAMYVRFPTPRPPFRTIPPPPTPHPTLAPTATPVPTAPPIVVTPTPVATVAPTGTLPMATTGINRWWTYETGTIPGAGSWMLNVGTGNLLVQETDVDIAERGIDLAFRRTYNSASDHDAAGSDGATPSLFGNGWTNTFDAHLAYNAAQNVMSVYDIDGARYDYTANGSGGWTPPPGMQGTSLASDGGCGYYWTKKTGTIYYFWRPTMGDCITASTWGYAGRLSEIIARNHNNHIAFTYSWQNGDSSNVQNVTQIVASHSDGQSLTLNFAKFGAYTELLDIVRPDGQIVHYAYDATGDLTDVCTPGNGSIDHSVNPVATCGDDTHIHHRYAYAGNHVMQWADSPRWTMSWGGPDATGSGGAYVGFHYGSSVATAPTSIQYIGYWNFIPNDGTNTLLQPAMINNTNNAGVLKTINIAYNSGQTSLSDSDGHAAGWDYDSAFRVTKTSHWTGSQWLITSAGWDANNDLISAAGPNIDPHTNQPAETDYGYDANGNTIWSEGPWVTANGSLGRPIARYAYDQYNNLLSSCDPEYIWQTGATACPTSGTGAFSTHQYDYSDAAEPYGYLVETKSALGYTRAIGYNAAQEDGDFGLPTSITGAPINESTANGTSQTVTSSESITYSATGNIVSYSNGEGTAAFSYDAMNRRVAASDSDPGNPTICAWYNPDGSMSATESPSERALVGGGTAGQCNPGYAPDQDATTFAYDADGNTISEITHYGCTTTASCTGGTSAFWYDGDDRLVESEQPSDRTVDNGVPSRKRFLYDLTQDGYGLQIGTAAGFLAHGNLFKTQRCEIGGSPCTWIDVAGAAYDTLNRTIEKYAYQPFGALQTWHETYDQGGENGFLTAGTDPMGVTTTPTYTADGELASVSYSDGTPSESYEYDPDGRVTAIASSVDGTDMYAYNATGDVTAYQEGLVPGGTSPESVAMTYYPNGLRSSMSISAVAFPNTQTMDYTYRSDGLRESLTGNFFTGAFTWAYSSAGRPISETDPFSGRTIAANASVSARTLEPETVTYNAFGEMNSLTMPSGLIYSNMTHDAEGAMSSANVGMQGYSPTATDVTSVAFSYNVRGELAKESGTDASGTTTAAISYEYGTSLGGDVDPKTGASLISNALTVTGENGICGYDADGRYADCEPGGNYGSPPSLSSNPVSYDAANQMLGIGGMFSYAYGASGQPRVYTDQNFGMVGGLPGTTMSMHWLGDKLLFTSDGNGKLLQENIENLATFGTLCATGEDWSCGLGVNDYGPTGALSSQHNAAGSSVNEIAGPTASYYPNVGSDPNVGGAVAPGGYGIYADGSGGFVLGPYTFEGTRPVNPTTGQWMTPQTVGGFSPYSTAVISSSGTQVGGLGTLATGTRNLTPFDVASGQCPPGESMQFDSAAGKNDCQPTQTPSTIYREPAQYPWDPWADYLDPALLINFEVSGPGQSLRTIATLHVHPRTQRRRNFCGPDPTWFPMLPGSSLSTNARDGVLIRIIGSNTALGLITLYMLESHHGALNYQLKGRAYRTESNFGIGVLGATAKYPQSELDTFVYSYLKYEDGTKNLFRGGAHTKLYKVDAENVAKGMQWALHHCPSSMF